MPWKETTRMVERTEFIALAKNPRANISALCRSFGISRKTAYKWLKRADQAVDLEDRSRQPHRSPGRTANGMELRVLEVREEHPSWGGRKIRRRLKNQGLEGVPAASTITAILRRHDKINPDEGLKHKPFERFERERPNELWQMDFKGYFALARGGYCHPLTVIDDHSRFLVGLKACSNETCSTVQTQLSLIFEQFGLPERMLMDNGSPWGDDIHSRYTIFTTWLIRLGIVVSHGRPYHPQTQGKNERLNRTLQAEVISRYSMATLPECQSHFDEWQYDYNYVRPHEALQLDTPNTHYCPSPRPFPTVLPPVMYDSTDLIRKVDGSGKISFCNHPFRVGKAFRHQPVAVRPTLVDGCFEVFFCNQNIATINLEKDNCGNVQV